MKYFLFLFFIFSAHAEITALKYNIGEDFTGHFGFLFQGWANLNEYKSPYDEDFRLRRAQFRFGGDIAKTVGYFLMVDPAVLIQGPREPSIDWDFMIKDFGLRYNFSEEFEILLGQFKIPTTADGLRPSWDLYIPERTLIGRTFGDFRELGMMIGYKKPKGSAYMMISDGRIVAIPDKYASTNLYGRGFYIPVEKLGVGGFFALKDFDYWNWGLDIHYEWDKFDFKAAYNSGNTSLIKPYGYSFELNYWINSDLSPVARYETFNLDRDEKPLGYAITLGLNYFLRGENLKFQLAGSSLYNMEASNGSPIYMAGVRNALITFCLQFFIL